MLRVFSLMMLITVSSVVAQDSPPLEPDSEPLDFEPSGPEFNPFTTHQKAAGGDDPFEDHRYCTISILTPDGQPATSASLCRYPDVPMIISDIPQREQAPSAANEGAPAKVRIHISENRGPGSPPSSLPKPAFRQLLSASLQGVCNTRLFIRHDSGYAIVSVPDQSESKVQLAPWVNYSGLVKLNGEAVSGGVVTAVWESFPHYGPLTSSNDLSQVPALVTIVRSAAVSSSGRYQFSNLPPGRIKFSFHPETSVESAKSASSALTWWETVSPQPTSPSSSLGLAGENLRDFKATRVSGVIEQTEVVYGARVQVVQSGERVAVTQKKMLVALQSDQVSTDAYVDLQPITNFSGNAVKSLNEIVKDAVVWGRKGGAREASNGWVAVPVDETGQFTAFLPPANYRGLLMMQADSGNAMLSYAAQGGIFEIESDQLAVESLNLDSINVDRVLAAVNDPRAQDKWLVPTDSNITPPYGNQRDVISNLRSPDPAATLSSLDRQVDSGNQIPSVDRSRYGLATGGEEAPTSVPSPNAAPINGFDSEIAQLVTRLLSANDRRLRDKLRPSLKSLLEKRFDAEQKSREDILSELLQRVEKAKAAVDNRKQQRSLIIQQQLERLMGLPEDDFPEAEGREDDFQRRLDHNDAWRRQDLEDRSLPQPDSSSDDLRAPEGPDKKPAPKVGFTRGR